MDIQQKIRILGIAAITTGAVTAFLCLFPRLLIIALPLGFAGMICSSIYVYIDTKHDVNTRKITPGIVGLVLSSSPVLLILTFIIINYLNH